jgi:hypothetical protein
MKNKGFAPIGSLHPILFFAVLYIIALMFAIFICSALFYSCNSSSGKIETGKNNPAEKQLKMDSPVAYR